MQEMKIYGLQACTRRFEVRPDSIIRMYFSATSARHQKKMVQWCVSKKKAYHVVSEKELLAVSASVHHEGICLVAERHKEGDVFELLTYAKEGGPLLFLEGVQNPQNIGAILRSAAHFGVRYLLGEKPALRLTSAAIRTAEGAAESVQLLPLGNSSETFAKLKELGYLCVATTSHKGQSLFHFRFPKKTLFVIGGERDGISKAFLEKADQIVQIPGTGAVESLNVSVATSVVLGEYYRRFG